MVLELASTYPNHVYLAHSTLSPKCNISLCSRSRSQAGTSYHGEVGHVHPQGSMHFILHPSDLALAESTGWAQGDTKDYYTNPTPGSLSEVDVVR